MTENEREQPARREGRQQEQQQGLLMVLTGTGKGKTTSALGMALRAVGHGHKVCLIQFIKGAWHYGELDALARLPEVEVHVMGRGFTWKSDNLEEDRRLALEAWDFACEQMRSGQHRLLILDELTYLMHYGMLDTAACLEGLSQRAPGLHVVVTGRYAPEALMEAADLVTEMRMVKHHLQQGIKAQRGIEF